MDGLLGLLLLLGAFVLFIFLVHRSIKTIVVMGIVVIAVLILKTAGFLG